MAVGDISRALVESILQQNAVVFIGAGVAASAGLPTWHDLCVPMAEAVGASPDLDCLLLAQCFEFAHGRAALNRFLQERMRSIPGHTECYRAIASLPASIFLTTNYDNLLESAFEEQGRPFTRVVIDAGLAQWMPGRDVLLWKLHGSADAGSFVISENDYQGYARLHPGASATLLHLLTTHTFLLLGCSLSDPNFRKVYDLSRSVLGKDYRRHFVVRASKSDVLAAMWENAGIQTIDVSSRPGDMGQRLSSFLLDLTVATNCEPKNLEERQFVFRRDEMRYLDDPAAVRLLTIRKEAGTGFLGISDDPTKNPFPGHDNSTKRYETSIERKQTYTRYLDGQAEIKCILSASPSYLLEKGYSRAQALWRLEALADFIQQHMSHDNLHIVLRTAPIGDSQSTSYNDDIHIRSVRTWGTMHRGEHGVVIRNPQMIRLINASFDDKFTSLEEANLREADALRIAVGRPRVERLKHLVVKKIEGEIGTIRSGS